MAGTEPRTCLRCGAPVVRPANVSNPQWERDYKYCGRTCRSLALRRLPRCACGCGEVVYSLRHTIKKGHRRAMHVAGYAHVFRPGHPLASKHGMVLEHRLVLHEAGVEIPAGHHVHHINGDRQDNRLENLAVLSPAEHSRAHRKTHCLHGHEFDEANTRVDKNGWRQCRTCGRERQRRRKTALAS